MGKLGLGVRIQLVLLACSVAVVVLIGIQVDGARKANVRNAGVITHIQGQQLQLRDVQARVEQMVRDWRGALLSARGTGSANHSTAFRSQRDLIMGEIQNLQARTVEASMSEALQTLVDSFTRLSDQYGAAMQGFTSSADPDPVQVQRGVADIDLAVVTLLEDMVNDYSLKQQDMQAKQEAITQKKYRIFAVSVVLILAGVSTILWAFIRWHLIRPLRELLDTAFKLSEDETETRVKYAERSDELGALARALKIFKRNRISELALIRLMEQSTQEREQQIKEEFEDRRHAGENELRERERQLAMKREDD